MKEGRTETIQHTNYRYRSIDMNSGIGKGSLKKQAGGSECEHDLVGGKRRRDVVLRDAMKCVQFIRFRKEEMGKNGWERVG